MTSRRTLGGIIHTYQKFDPHNFPSPTAEPPDLVSPAFEHMLAYGDMRELTDEELARAIRLDPSQIAGLGPSLDMLRAMLLERKRKILATYETEQVTGGCARTFHGSAASVHPPKPLADRFKRAVADEQLRELERLWYYAADDRDHFAGQLMRLVARLGEKYQVDELAAKYAFTGRTPMTVPQALEIKEELETIDRLLKQLEEAAKTAQIGIIDLEELSQFTDPAEVEKLETLQRRVEELMRQIAEQQGLERGKEGYRLTPQAYRLFQGRLLERIFSQLEASRSGRHQGPVVGEGAVEMQQTKGYEFGDSVANMDLTALVHQCPGARRPRLADPAQGRRHRNPSHAQFAQMRHGGAGRHVGLDALRRAVHPRQTDGFGARRPGAARISGRLAAIHRDVYLCQAASDRRNCGR